MKVLIAGGGTGGHLFPGIALAEELIYKGVSSKKEIVFVGTPYGIEAQIIPRHSYQLRFINASGFVGKSFFNKIKALLNLFLGFFESMKIINEIKPQVVVGIGGYGSIATVLSAKLKGLPTVILEQNSVPGLSNRLLGNIVDAIAVTFQDSISYFPEHKTYLTGNPIRREIVKKDKRASCLTFSLDPERFTIFVFGGSAGASSINKAVLESLNLINDLSYNIQFIHQTGKRDFKALMEAYKASDFKAYVAPFIYEMAEAYSAADIIICRAGATTLAELTAIGRPAILIPYPYAAGGHQAVNAQRLVDMGAALIINDEDLNGTVLAKNLRELYNNDDLRSKMQKMSMALGKVDASERIVNIVLNLVREVG
ncbi:MAG: undecaprenyldiphospho-muramoylpentapeptide beta-N-acetylglucosaminyltransferase [Thermodesulfovibrionales bacterium]|nr:undecaprenyldiphospho-muramoylpentapeptide beta-N-acetylglucosaminyltransferase [Thermodesulfovibrionales bacterium]